jgi:hypothetical protein
MFQEFFQARADLLIWPLIGLGIFVTSFLLVLAYVGLGLRDGHKRDEIAALPLADDSFPGRSPL